MLHNIANFNEFYYFVHIIQAGSFSKAAEKLGITPSALSQNIRNLETRLNVRLINRTTRSISPTDAGEQLYANIAPHFRAITDSIQDLDDWHDTPQGTIRINTSELAAREILYPKLRPLLQENPHLRVELMVDNRWVDIVAEGFDMGVRLGYAVYQDMISVQISAPMSMALVATPDYLQDKKVVEKIEDLLQHDLIACQFASHQQVDTWEFVQDGETVRFTPHHARFVNNGSLQYDAARDGLGIAWLARHYVADDLASGALVELLPHSVQTYDPMYLYYPNRKGHSKIFQMVVDAVRLQAA